MRRKLFFLLLLANLLSVPVFSAPSKSPKKVHKVEISVQSTEGDSSSKQAIEASMLTKEGGAFVQKDFDKDLKKLSEKYENIDSQVQSSKDGVTIHLSLQPKSKISEIIFKGDPSIKQKKLREILNIKPDTPFNQKDFNKAFAELKKYYTKQGFYEAELDYKLEPQKDNKVAIVIDISEGKAGRIRDITFSGIDKKEQEILEEDILTKPYFFLTSWMSGKGTYDEQMLEQDKMIILRYFHNKGYADVTVKSSLEETDDNKRVDLHFSIEKGKKYTFHDIEFEGNELFSNEQIQKLITLHSGETYSPESIQATVQSIQDAYGKNGYVDAQVSYELSLVPNTQAYNIDFSIYEGQPYRVGLIKVFGNTNTHNSVILHETLLVPGELFDTRKLQKTEERLHNIGYFQNVNVYAAKSEGTHPLGADYRDVYIEVEETGTGNLSLFFGFSTLDSIFGGAEIAEQNFNYKGIPKLFSEGPSALRGGGEFFKFKFSIGRKYSTFLLGWSKPFFMDTKWEAGFNIERSFSSLQSEDYEIESTAFSLHASYPLAPFWRFGWNYTIQNSTVSVDSKASEQLKRQAKIDGLVSSTGINFSYDSSDRPIMPTKGFRSSIGFNLAGLGGKVNFLEYSYINSYYLTPIEEWGTFKTRLDLQFLQPILGSTANTIPFDNRYYLGGETSVRGYRGFAIGPKFSNNDPKGGISSLLISEEYMQNLFKNISAFVFFDAGSITDREYHIGKLYASYGGGVQIEIMRGVPIIVGMGFPINAPDKSDIQRFFISIGGRF